MAKMDFEPIYDIGGCSHSYCLTELHCQNFEFSGFIPLVQQTYEAMRIVDRRLDCQMPYAAFLHYCTVYLNAIYLDHVSPFGFLERCQDAIQVGSSYLIPEVIQEYARNIVKIITPTGVKVNVNVPKVSIPQEGSETYESGFFGKCDASTHNVYECYVSAAVTARYLEACRDQNTEWKPLPDELTPAGGIPTFNLLGYDSIQLLNQEGRARLTGIYFPNNSSIFGRLRFSPELNARVSRYLETIKDKFKSSPTPRHTTFRSGLANVVYAQTDVTVPDRAGGAPLSHYPVNLYSYTSFGAQTANHALLDVMHRRRVKEAKGFCFIKEDGTAFNGWEASMNYNFEMTGQFAPVTFVDYPMLRIAKHASIGRGRILPLAAWVKKLEL